MSLDWDTKDVAENEKRVLINDKLILGEYDIIDPKEENVMKIFMRIYLKEKYAKDANLFEKNVLQKFLLTQNNVNSIYRTESLPWFKCDYLIEVIDTPHNIFDLILKIHAESKENQLEIRTKTYVVVERLAWGLFNEYPIRYSANKDLFSLPLNELIKKGENEKLEFKASLRWNYNKNIVDKELENPVIEAICGFMNSDGGILLIGVDNQGNVLGLDKDFSTLQDKNRDGFERHITSLIIARIGKEFRDYVNINCDEKIDDKIICKIVIPRRSSKPVYFGKDRNFFVRQGNRTSKFNPEEANNYKESHW